MEFVCMIEAIPENERPAHFALAAELFGRLAQERRDLPNGYSFRFAPEALEPLARFVSKERRCSRRAVRTHGSGSAENYETIADCDGELDAENGRSEGVD